MRILDSVMQFGNSLHLFKSHDTIFLMEGFEARRACAEV